jgi:hypothetical protein
MTVITPNSPLTPAVFHILLALSSRERHGYGIMKQVEADTQGTVSMGNGALYGSLKRMLDAGLVEESDKRVDPSMDGRAPYLLPHHEPGDKSACSGTRTVQAHFTLAQERKLHPKTIA